MECSLALGLVAAETREGVAAQQSSGSRPWVGVDGPSDVQHLQAEHAVKLQEGLEKLTGVNDPRHVLQQNWGLRTSGAQCGPGCVRGLLHCRKADGGPHPAVTRTLQYAADISSSRNGQQMSAKSLLRRWKHGIQIALLRWRAAMARAVLPNPSARAEWLFRWYH